MNKQHRTFNNTNARADDTGKVISVAISSEQPYLRQRFNGHQQANEILVHSPEAVDLSYMQGAPFFLDHDTEQLNTGAVFNARIDNDRVLRGDVRFSNRMNAQEIANDMERGIRGRISVGYEIHEMSDGPIGEDGIQIVYVTKWKPYEVSSVAVPADITVGVGRAMNEPQSQGNEMKREDEQPQADVAAAPVPDDTAKAGTPDLTSLSLEQLQQLLIDAQAAIETVTNVPEKADDEPAEPEAPAADGQPPLVDGNSNDDANAKAALVIGMIKTAIAAKQTKGKATMALNKEAIDKLSALAVKYGKTGDLGAWIAEQRSVESVSAEILSGLDNTATVVGAPAVHIKREKETMADALKAGLSGQNSEILERGISQRRAAGQPIVAGRIYLPTDFPMLDGNAVRAKAAQKMTGQRAGLAFTGTGVNGTGKEYLTFEESLRELALLSRLGGEIRTFNDAASLPYWGTGLTAVTAHETGSLTQQTPVVSLKSLTPKRIGATTIYSNLMARLNGSYDMAAEVYTELLADTERLLEAQIFGGAGTGNELLGIANDTNIPTYTPTPASGSMSTLAASSMVSVVAKNNANFEAGKWAVAHDVYASMWATPVFGNGSGRSVLEQVAEINPVFRTGFLPSPNTPQLAAVFGDWSKVTAALFGGLEIRTDDITAAASAQTILTSELFADVLARQPLALVKWLKVIAP